MVLGENRLEAAHGVAENLPFGNTRRRPVGIGCGQAIRGEQERLEHRVEAGDAADADAADRVAVVGLAEGEVAGLLRPRPLALAPVLEGQLQGDLDRRRSVVGEEHVLEAGRGQIDQPPGQTDRRRIGASQGGHVGDAVELLAERSVEPGMAMAMHIAPQAARAVDVAVAVDVDQRAAVALLEDQRFVLGHLGEGVPDELAVPSGELFP